MINSCLIHRYDACSMHRIYNILGAVCACATTLDVDKKCIVLSVKLKLLVRDTRVQTKYALEETYNLAKHNCVGYIGAWNSGTTIEVSNLLSIPSIDRAIIAYSASSPRLSEPDFSNVLRTKESDVVPTKLIAKLMTGMYF